MENFEKKIHVKNYRKDSTEDVAQMVEMEFDRRTQEIAARSVPIEQVLGEGAAEKVENLKDIIRKKLKQRGIDEALFLPIFFSKTKVYDVKGDGTDTLKAENDNGNAKPNCIEMFDIEVEDLLVKQLAVLQVLSHELYHATARQSMAVTDSKVKTEASGASFRNHANWDQPTLLEEGAAMQFEYDVRDEVNSIFPEETVSSFNNTLQKARQDKKENSNLVESNTEIRLVYDKDGQYGVVETENYTESKIFVEYLAAKIPNFYPLLEKGRVYGKIGELSKAVDATFGAGSYRRIATATTTDATTLLGELRAIEVSEQKEPEIAKEENTQEQIKDVKGELDSLY